MNSNRLRNLGAACLLLVLSASSLAQQNNLIVIDPNQVTVTETKVNTNQQPQPGPHVTTTQQDNTQSGLQPSAGYLSPPGSPLCGGIVNGKLQTGCGYTKAGLVGQARKDCPAGSFFDVGTWSCYTCPPGYSRTGNHVDQWDACSKDVKDQVSRATYLGKAPAAPAGAKFDPRNGGEYWSCPAGLDRTWAPVDAWDACGMIGKEPKPAAFLTKACAMGWHDPRNGGECWSCPSGFIRTAAAVDQHNACIRVEDLKPATKRAALTCAAGDHFDFVDGGSCWRCPKDSNRSIFDVKGAQACEYVKLRWKSPPRQQPGLFGLDGAEEVALAVLAEPKIIEESVGTAARQRAGNPQQWIADEWALIAREPGKSAMLNGALMLRVMDAAALPPAQRSPAEARLIAALEKAMQENRLFVADQAQQYYDNWVAKRWAEIAQKHRGMSLMFVNLGKPPEISDLIADVVGGGAGIGAMGAGIAAVINGPQFLTLVPHAKLTGEALKAVKLAADGVLNAAKGTLTTAGSGMGSVAAAAAGPLLIITGASIIAQVVISDEVDAERVRLITKNNLEAARKPVNLGNLLLTEKGSKEFMYYWGMITNASSRPGPAIFSRVASIAAEKGAGPAVFDIVSEAGTCLQAMGTKVSLVACNRANPTRWISKQGALVPVGSQSMCLTANGPTLVQCQPTNPQAMTQQIWRLEPTGQIVSGTGLMLVAREGAVTNMPIDPRLAGSKWKAETK